MIVVDAHGIQCMLTDEEISPSRYNQEKSLRELQKRIKDKIRNARHPSIAKVYEEVDKMIEEQIDKIWESYG